MSYFFNFASHKLKRETRTLRTVLRVSDVTHWSMFKEVTFLVYKKNELLINKWSISNEKN